MSRTTCEVTATVAAGGTASAQARDADNAFDGSEREEPPPRIVALRYAIEVVTDEPDERVELLHKNLRKFGTITNTLAAACAVEGTLTAVRGSGAA